MFFDFCERAYTISKESTKFVATAWPQEEYPVCGVSPTVQCVASVVSRKNTVHKEDLYESMTRVLKRKFELKNLRECHHH